MVVPSVLLWIASFFFLSPRAWALDSVRLSGFFLPSEVYGVTRLTCFTAQDPLSVNLVSVNSQAQVKQCE